MNSLITEVELKAKRQAEARWKFAKVFVEPHIQEAANDENAMGLLPNHEFLIRSHSQAQCIVKCRKTAHSWCIALDAIARAYIEPRSTSIIISINEKEAKDKNNFIDWIYGVLPNEIKNEMKIDGGSEERRFANGSRIQLRAHQAPTGAGATIYCDEFSVEPHAGASAGEILTAAIGCTTHSGYIRVGGTERGPLTIFHQIVSGQINDMIAEGAEGFEGLPSIQWEIGKFEWWKSSALCLDVETAWMLAPNMPTDERVKKFGNDRLKRQYVMYLTTPEQGLEIFQREFECVVLDDKESYYSIDLIRKSEAKGSYLFEHSEANGAAEIEKALRSIDNIAYAIRDGLLRGDFAATMDVGRDHDRTEICVGHSLPEDKTHIMVRAIVTLNYMPFPLQQKAWTYLMDRVKTTKGYIDGTKGSIGRQLSEWANQQYNQRAMPFEFTPSNRQIICTGLRSRMEKNAITIPDFEPLRIQLLSVKKRITASGSVLFDVERNKHGHADKFFSVAMLSDLYEQPESNYAFTPITTGQGTSSGREALLRRGGSIIRQPQTNRSPILTGRRNWR